MSNYVPYILTIFSNPAPNTAGHLPYLDTEKEELQKMFAEAKKNSDTNVDDLLAEDKPEDNLDSPAIGKLIKEFKKRLTVIHYSGHADTVMLTLNQQDVRAQNFVKYISDCDSAKLVVLNGCSTQGFVKLLLETTGVKAVIATNNPVRDDRAMKFSVNFYEALLEKKTLSQAYTLALSYAQDNFTMDENIFQAKLENKKITSFDLLADENKQGMRAVKKAKQHILEQADQIAPWGLFTRSMDVLDWKLFESATADEKKLQEFTVKIRKAEADIKELEPQIRQLEVFIDLLNRMENPTDEHKLIKAENENKVTDLKGRIASLHNDIAALQQSIDELSTEKNDDELLKSYQEAFFKLNYLDQRKTIFDAKKKAALDKYSCFILHGSNKSCIHLLSRRLRNWLGFNNEKKAIFDYASHHLGNFWQKLQHDLLGRIVSSDRETIVKELHKLYRNQKGETQNHLLLIFRISVTETEDTEKYIDSVFDFWGEFIALFRKLEPAGANDHNIYSFIIDNSCEVFLFEECYKSNRQDTYVTLHKKYPDIKPSFQLLPVVGPVDADHLWEWQLDSTIRDEYRYTFPELEKLVQDTAGILLDTVEQYCSKKIDNPVSKKKILNHVKENIDIPIQDL
jgi:hypothetical protein